MVENDVNFHEHLKRWKKAVRQHIRRITRAAMLLLLGFVVLHKIYPQVEEWTGELLGFERPSLAAVFALLALLFILERIIVLEQVIANPPMLSFESRVDAYDKLADLIRERGHRCRSIDLVQFSGQTALPVFTAISRANPRASVRLLLLHPECAAEFHPGQGVNHVNRINNTVENIELLEKDEKFEGFSVEIRHYRTPASAATVVVDEDLVSLGWYLYFTKYNTDSDTDDSNRGALHLRGHNVAAINGRGEAVASLRDFALHHFQTLWETAEPARNGSPQR
jgi:hypothetical protein